MSSLLNYFSVNNALDIEKIGQFIDHRQIKSLYHFTHLDHIASIQENGLLDVKSLTQRSILHVNSGARDFLPGYGIFLSISGPNDYMRFHKRFSMGLPLVILEIEGTDSVKQILSQIPFIASPGNSSSQDVAKLWKSNPIHFRSINGLQNQFRNTSLRERFILDPHEPTDPQSEIIFLGGIPSRYITRWHIPENLFDQAVQKFGDQNCFHKDYKFSQGGQYELNKAREEKEVRTWRIEWLDIET